MPELVPKGPDIPVDLLNRLDDESGGLLLRRRCLDGWQHQTPGLLCQVYNTKRIKPDGVEAGGSVSIAVCTGSQSGREPRQRGWL